jgi:predicted nucleic acid-binding protein
MTSVAYYLDTNALISARCYLEVVSENIYKEYPLFFSDGNNIIKALEKYLVSGNIRIITSLLTVYEFNNKYSQYVRDVYLRELGFPSPIAMDARGKYKSKASDLKQGHIDELKKRTVESSNWLRTWVYKNIVEIIDPGIKDFELAQDLKIIAPNIDFYDALHICSALANGCEYFVTEDEPLKKSIKLINIHLPKLFTLPTGQPLYQELKPISSVQFQRDSIRWKAP